MIKLDSPFQDPIRNRLFSLVDGPLEKLLAFDQVNQIYIAGATAVSDKAFAGRVLESMQVSFEVSEADLRLIPKTGRVVVVANHPFGGIEGLILSQLLKSVRDDVKLMANFLLERVPDLRDMFIFVDPFARPDSARANMKPLKETMRWLNEDHVLGVFPAGAVSHIDLRKGRVIDPEWNETIGRIIRRTESPVIPIFIRGSNSLLFQLLGMVHPNLRTAMLPHEFVKKRGQTIRLRIGNPIPYRKLEPMSDEELMAYIRMRTYHLRHRKDAPKKERRRIQVPVRFIKPKEVPIIPAVSPDLLVNDISALPPTQKLLQSGPMDVYFAYTEQIPHVMRELGRLREETFRAIGEGTGQAIDTDRFDDYYIHLFIWQREKREIVGAYRLGKSDVIMKQLGKRGLYTSTLFRYRKRLLKSISPALEMGRSFVQKDYQRSYSSLLLLWKGLAHFVLQHPQYKILFGPVSINNDYHTMSRQMLVSFLEMHNFLPDLAKLVKAKTPMRIGPLKKWKLRQLRTVANDIDDVDSLISDIEADLKGVPILLRQYLRLGGRLLAFNIDPDFSNVLDGLILVDLTKTDPKVLERYMTKDGVVQFRSFHGLDTPGKEPPMQAEPKKA